MELELSNYFPKNALKKYFLFWCHTGITVLKREDWVREKLEAMCGRTDSSKVVYSDVRSEVYSFPCWQNQSGIAKQFFTLKFYNTIWIIQCASLAFRKQRQRECSMMSDMNIALFTLSGLWESNRTRMGKKKSYEKRGPAVRIWINSSNPALFTTGLLHAFNQIFLIFSPTGELHIKDI